MVAMALISVACVYAGFEFGWRALSTIIHGTAGWDTVAMYLVFGVSGLSVGPYLLNTLIIDYPKSVTVILCTDGVHYTFWTPDGQVERHAPYDSFTHIRHMRRISSLWRGRYTVWTDTLEIVHPNALLTLPLFVGKSGGLFPRASGFDENLAIAYSQATGLRVVEAHVSILPS